MEVLAAVSAIYIMHAFYICLVTPEPRGSRGETKKKEEEEINPTNMHAQVRI